MAQNHICIWNKLSKYQSPWRTQNKIKKNIWKTYVGRLHWSISSGCYSRHKCIRLIENSAPCIFKKGLYILKKWTQSQYAGISARERDFLSEFQNTRTTWISLSETSISARSQFTATLVRVFIEVPNLGLLSGWIEWFRRSRFEIHNSCSQTRDFQK